MAFSGFIRHLLMLLVAISGIVAEPCALSARTSSLEALVGDFQAEAGPTLRGLAARGHRIGVALAPALPPEARAAGSFADRLARRLSTLPAAPDADPGESLRFALLATMSAPAPDSTVGSAVGPAPASGWAPAGSREAVVLEARRRGWSRVLRVEVAVRDGQLILVGEILESDGLLWEPLMRPVTGTAEHFYAARRLDAELRALLDLPFPPLATSWSVRPLPILVAVGGAGADSGGGAPAGVPGQVLDIAVGDVDGDGDDEVLVLTRSTLHVYRAAPGGLAAAAPAVPLAPIAGTAAARSRVPVGGLLLAPVLDDRRVDVVVTTSDLSGTPILAWQGDGLAPVPWSDETPSSGADSCVRDGVGADPAALLVCGVPVGQGAAGELLLRRTERGRATFPPSLERWRPAAVSPAPPAALRGAGLGMRRHWVQTRTEGAPLVIDARLSTAGVLRVDRSVAPGAAWSPPRLVRDVGYAFTVFDANDDGAPELAAASSVPPGSTDTLSVWTLPDDGVPQPVWRGPDAGLPPIQAVAAGDVDHDGRPELVVATWAVGADASALLLVRGEDEGILGGGDGE